MNLQEERYLDIVSPKEEIRYSSDRNLSDRYYDDRGSNYYRDIRDERDMGINSNNGAGNITRHNLESTEPDRGVFKTYKYDCSVLI